MKTKKRAVNKYKKPSYSTYRNKIDGAKLMDVLRSISDYEGDIHFTKKEVKYLIGLYPAVSRVTLKKGFSFDSRYMNVINDALQYAMGMRFLAYKGGCFSMRQIGVLYTYSCLLEASFVPMERRYELWKYLGSNADKTINTKEYLYQFANFLCTLATASSSFQKRVFAFDLNIPNNMNYLMQSCINLKLAVYHATTRMFIDDGKKRMAYRLIISRKLNLVEYVKVEIPAQFNENKTEKLPVYIQSHALERLKERMDVMAPAFHDILLTGVFCYAQDIHESNGRLFFPLKLLTLKFGYFVGKIIDNCIVIKTFHFITHVQTPEGKLLRKIGMLQADDIEYWKLDRISTFMKMNPKKDAKLFNLFKKAGCEYLFFSDLEDGMGQGEVTVQSSIADFIERGIREVKGVT